MTSGIQLAALTIPVRWMSSMSGSRQRKRALNTYYGFAGQKVSNVQLAMGLKGGAHRGDICGAQNASVRRLSLQGQFSRALGSL